MRWWLPMMLVGCGRLGFDPVAGSDTGSDTLRAVPDKTKMNLGAVTPLDIGGGSPPYTISLVGPGFVAPNGSAYEFTSPLRAGTTTIEVEDANGARASTQIRFEGDFLYLAGGSNGPVDDRVWRSSDGATWSQIGRLPAPRRDGALVPFHDTLYYVGGEDAGSVASDVIYASNDGVTWTDGGRLPARRTSFAMTTHRGEVWLVGGYDGVDRAEVFHTKDFVQWVQAASIPAAMHEISAFSRDDTLFVLGGHNTGVGMFYSSVYTTTDGSSFATIPAAMNIAADYTGAGELGDLVVHVCGVTCTDVEVSTDLRTWTLTSQLQGTVGAQLIGFRGALLLLAGNGPPAIHSTTDGITWTTIGAFPEVLERSAGNQFTPP